MKLIKGQGDAIAEAVVENQLVDGALAALAGQLTDRLRRGELIETMLAFCWDGQDAGGAALAGALRCEPSETPRLGLLGERELVAALEGPLMQADFARQFRELPRSVVTDAARPVPCLVFPGGLAWLDVSAELAAAMQPGGPIGSA